VGDTLPDSWVISNGNILPKDWIESKTLEDGTTITLNDDDTITVNKVAGQELKLPIYSYKADSGAYCWDETANEDMYFIFDVPASTGGLIPAQIISNPGQHLIEFDPSFSSFSNVLSLYAAAEVSGTYIIHRPTLTNMRAPVRYVPYMEPIIINNTKESLDFNEILDIAAEPFCGSLVIHSDDYKGYYNVYVDAVPKSIINENRMQFILDDLKEEISTSLILKSPNGTKFNITVNDDGTLSTTQI
jgi:hypothetical protein